MEGVSSSCPIIIEDEEVVSLPGSPLNNLSYSITVLNTNVFCIVLTRILNVIFKLKTSLATDMQDQFLNLYLGSLWWPAKCKGHVPSTRRGDDLYLIIIIINTIILLCPCPNPSPRPNAHAQSPRVRT